MDRAELSRLIQVCGLPRLCGILEASAVPAIRIRTRSIREADLGWGRSRIGGPPDLPKGMAWPSGKGKPLSPLAQINLSELRKHDAEGALPPAGLLSFFYDGLACPWGFDPADRDSWKVLYFPEQDLVRSPLPRELGAEGAYSCCELRFASSWSLPSTESLQTRGVELSEEEFDAYFDLAGEIDGIDGMKEHHQLLGYAAPVQNEMELECQLVSHGLYCGDSSGTDDPRAAALAAGAADWRLLFQLDSDDAASMMWGDLGMLYFWIRKQDLSAREFGKVWTILQCG